MHGEPQETGERAMGLIALITNSYLKGGGGADWRFCLLLSSILVDITNNSVYKGIIVSFEKRGQKWTGDVEPSAGYLVLFKWSIQHRLNIGYGSRKGKIQKIFCKSNWQCFFFSQITVEEFVKSLFLFPQFMIISILCFIPFMGKDELNMQGLHSSNGRESQ